MNLTEGKHNQLKQKISQAITKFEQTQRNMWAFQVERYENEEGEITSSIEQYNPSNELEKRWSLVRINDEQPTSKQIKKFVAKKLEQAENKKQGNNFSIALKELINQESIKFSAESDLDIEVIFDVYLKKLGESSKGKLTGKLLYNKQLAYIEKLIIENTAEFSPVFSANISEFKLTIIFTNIDDHILPKQHNMEMKGTFAFFTEINEVSTDTFSNYKVHEAISSSK
ncbi:hypothetical protein HII17_05290 [Thalassotalea sp. M1531]|uniref:Uncharacterized protein n=1 Tax=Thalassotalea algicola TaxID=2716224 RepID=A0A7Y0LAH9_9GAMM|nr:hypothetical protein [Thalassotalea algicola]NMP30973.1 hypothetical protein [Thalassotalea algicola]